MLLHRDYKVDSIDRVMLVSIYYIVDSIDQELLEFI